MKTKISKTQSNILSRLFKVVQKRARLLVPRGADPWVIFNDGWYYYCRVINDWQIAVGKAKAIENIGQRLVTIWHHPLGSPEAEVWAPELHKVQNKWYVYFTMGKADKHRMFVLEAESDDPQGAYNLRGQISDASNKWAIDGTVLQLKDKLYFIWSGWEGDVDGKQNLYIAPMSNPWTISGERVRITEPTFQWEKTTQPGLCHVNEGPEILEHDGRVFIIYSASHSLTDDYCLGMLSLDGDDPLKPTAWKKAAQPVFCKTKETFGPGHASFIKDTRGLDWIIYHAARSSGSGWDRQVLAQRFTWKDDGTPYFGKPLAVNHSSSLPINLFRKPQQPSITRA